MDTRLPKQVILSPNPGRVNTVPSPYQPFLESQTGTGMDNSYSDVPRKPHKLCRRVAKPEFKRPDPRTETLGLDIGYIQSTIEHAAGTGGGCMELQPGDDDIAARNCPGLAGCSVQAYNTIIYPLKSLRVTLKTIEMALEDWATKAKMMESQVVLIERIDRDDSRTANERMRLIKGIIYDEIDYIDENYVYSFHPFAQDMQPTVRALWDLQNLLLDICNRLNIDVTDEKRKPQTPRTKRSSSWSTLVSGSTATPDSSQTTRERRPDRDEDQDMLNQHGSTMDTPLGLDGAEDNHLPNYPNASAPAGSHPGPSSDLPPPIHSSRSTHPPTSLARCMFADEFFGKYTSLYSDSKLNPKYNPALAATAPKIDPILRVYAYAFHLSFEATDEAVRIYNLAKGYQELAEQMRRVWAKWDTAVFFREEEQY